MVGIIDYGCGNVGSVQNMLSKAGIWSETISVPAEIKGKEALILPGVGAFDSGVQKLKETGFWNPIKEAVEKESMPILGICLGMQLFFEESEEGTERGFGWIPGKLLRFKAESGLRVPHMGWKQLLVHSEHPRNVIDQLNSEFYFVHSYHAPENLGREYIMAECQYGIPFPAAVVNKNITGFQFHPEKSLKHGMHLLSSWYQSIKSE